MVSDRPLSFEAGRLLLVGGNDPFQKGEGAGLSIGRGNRAIRKRRMMV